MWTDPGNIYIVYIHMNVKIETEAAQFPSLEYINGIFVAVLFEEGFLKNILASSTIGDPEVIKIADFWACKLGDFII